MRIGFMEEEKERLLKIIKEAAASVRMEKLPLSSEQIEEYTRRRLEQLENGKSNRLVLKRGVKSAR